MTSVSYVFVFSVLAVFLEALLRSLGIFLPLLGIFVFYAVVVFGPRTGFTLAVFGGAALDFILGHSTPVSALALSLTGGLSLFWLYKVESDSIPMLALPGALIPVLAYVPLTFWNGGIVFLFRHLPDLFLSSFCTAFLLPLEILMLDLLNQRLELKLYLNAKLERRRS